MRVKLHENHTISNASIGDKISGTWTMMYDQGMILRINHSNLGSLLYYANFRYEVRPGYNIEWINESNYSSFESKCDKTMIGIAIEKSSLSYRCFTASNISPAPSE